MRYDSFALDCPASNASGDPSGVRSYVDKWFQVSGTFSATIALEGTIDASTYVALVNTTTPGIFEIPQAVRQVRCTVSSYTSGTPVVTFAGRNPRAV